MTDDVKNNVWMLVVGAMGTALGIVTKNTWLATALLIPSGFAMGAALRALWDLRGDE